MNTRSAIAHLLFAISTITTAAYAADHIRAVAMTGQQAPGFPTGVTFQLNNISIATINASGELTFVANLGGLGIDSLNNNTVWVGTPDNLQLLAQEGQPAPGTEPDTVFDAFTPLSDGFESPIAPNGEVAFWAYVRGPSVTFGDNSSGIWAGMPGNLQLIAREGDPAPGTEAGTVFNSIDHRYAYNDGGAVFYATLSGPSVDGSNDYGIWAGRAGNVQLVVREGGAAPDLPPGDTLESLGIQSSMGALNINSQGDVSFSVLTRTATDRLLRTVYAGAPGVLDVIAREGDPALGVQDASFGDIDFAQPPSALNDAGQVSFSSPLTPLAGGSSISSLWVGTATSLTLAALKGTSAPASLPPDTVYNSLGGDQVLNAAGKLAVVATVDGPNVTSSNNQVLLAGTAGALTLLAREGDPAPGTEAGVVYSTGAAGPFNAPFMNSSNEIAFYTTLDGTTSNRGIWIMKPGAPPRLIVRDNDSFDAGGGNIVTISDNGLFSLHFSYFNQSMSSGNQDGRPSAFSDNGQVVFSATLTGIGRSILIADPLDTDNEGVRDNLDNCIDVANADQRDTDGDGYGNLCDGDLNNDGSTNTLDLNLYKLAHRSTVGDANYNTDADFNGDGTINTLDLNIYKSLHRNPPGPSCCGSF